MPLENSPAHHRDDPPPVLGTWPRVYAAVLVYLCCLIAVFYVFTRAYRPS